MNSSGLKWSVFARGHERGRRTCEWVRGRGECVAEGRWVSPLATLLHHGQIVFTAGGAATRCLLLCSEESVLHVPRRLRSHKFFGASSCVCSCLFCFFFDMI